MRLLKWLILVIVLLIAIPTATLAFILFGLDPNWLKPEIEKRLAAQGVHVTLGDEIGWMFYPRLGISLSEAHLHASAAKRSEDQLASLEALQFALAIKPLLQQQLEVSALRVAGATVTYVVDAEGKSNWDDLLQRPASTVPTPTPPPAAEGHAVAVKIDKLQLENIALNYRNDATQQALQISALALLINNLNLVGETAPLSFSAQLQYQQYPALNLSMKSALAYDQASQHVRMSDLSLAIHHPNQQVISATADATLDLQASRYAANLTLNIDGFGQWLQAFVNTPPAEIQLMNLQRAAFTVAATYDGTTQQVVMRGGKLLVDHSKGGEISLNFDTVAQLTPVDATSNFAVGATQLRDWLHTAAVIVPETIQAKALHTASVTGKLSASENALNMQDILIRIDDTQLNGQLAMQMHSQKPLPAINTSWRSPELNLDKFLAPPSKPEPSPAPAPPAADTPLPVEQLRNLDVQAKLQIDRVVYQGLQVDAVNTELKAQDGLVEIPTLNAKVGEGRVEAKAHLDARSQEAQTALTLRTSQLDVGHLLLTFADFSNLAGSLNSDIELTTKGNSTQQMHKNLSATASVDSPLMTVSPVNIVRSFCQAVAFVERKEMAPREWAEFTSFTPVKIQAQINGTNVQLNSLTAVIEKFNASARGSYDIEQGKFDFPFELKLADFAAELEGCNFISEEWRKKALPLRCKGSLAKLGVDTCGPDYELIKEKWKQKLEQKVDAEKQRAQEKLNEEKARAEDKLESKIRSELERKLSKDEVDNIKDLLRKKDNKTTTESAPKATESPSP